MVFFILEATVTSYGLLAIGGVVAMLLGSMMLIKTDVEFLQISWSVILPVVALTAAFSLFMVGMGVRAMRRRPATGREEMVGLVGIVQTALTPTRATGGPWRTVGGHQRSTAPARRQSGSHTRRGLTAVCETSLQADRGLI